MNMNSIENVILDRKRNEEVHKKLYLLQCIHVPFRGKFTQEEWHLSTAEKRRLIEDERHLAENIARECERICDKTKELTRNMKDASDHKCGERISDLEFSSRELETKRKEICLQLDGFEILKNRAQRTIKSCENAKTISRKCILFRDQRIGIDLVEDDAEQRLRDELLAVEEGLKICHKCLEQIVEQQRRLRAIRYMIDRDLTDKATAINIDKACMNLLPTDTTLHSYHGHMNLDPAFISLDEWNHYTFSKIQETMRELYASNKLYAYVDEILNRVCDDITEAYNSTNRALEKKICDTKKAKMDMEEAHANSLRITKGLEEKIISIQEALREKENYAALAHTRLGMRANRPAMELVIDQGAKALMVETAMLRKSAEELQLMLHEATSSLRYILQSQIQLIEEINTKMNTLKIDEVDCMTIRNGFSFNH